MEIIKPRLTLPGVEVYIGNAIDVVKRLAPVCGKRVHSVVTSPPYFNLRDYGTGTWEGGDQDCPHKPSDTPGKRGIASSTLGGGKATTGHQQEGYRKVCPRCGARRVDEQIGIEDTAEQFVSRLCDLFDSIGEHLLRSDGSLWVNLGDSYAGSGGAGGDYNEGGLREGQPKWKPPKSDYPAKSLMLVPERFALEMIRRGWILRNRIIWFKGKDVDEPLDEEDGGAPTSNGMPASADDRLKGTYEVVFHFARAQRYFYQLDEIREQHPEAAGPNQPLGRNPGDVWAIPPSPFPLAHFATFPPALVHRPVKATCPVAVCKACGAPMVLKTRTEHVNPGNRTTNGPRSTERRHETAGFKVRLEKRVYVEGYKPTCTCNAGWEGAVLLDPFMGSGATAEGAFQARPPQTFDGHHCHIKVVGIDLDERNLPIIEKRLTGRAKQGRKVDLSKYDGGFLGQL